MNGKWIVISLLVLTAATGRAQSTPNFDTGVYPYRSYDLSSFDSVDLSGGNLIFHVPVISYPQRGTLPDFSLSLLYNNKSWELETPQPCEPSCNSPFWVFTGNGVQLARDGYLTATELTQTASDGTEYYTNTVSDSTGASHLVGYTSSDYTTAETIDASGIRVNYPTGLSPTIYTSSGISYTDGCGAHNSSGQCVQVVHAEKDPYGNTITTNYPNSTSTTVSSWTDSFQRNIPAPAGYSGEGSGCETDQYPGPPGAATVPIKFCYSPITATPQFSGPYEEQSYTVEMISSIILPSGQGWTFTYNSWGDLQTVTSPAGGSITYNWQTRVDCQGNQGRAIQSRTITYGSQSQEWQYGFVYGTDASGLATEVTTVTDPMGNQTVHTFDPACGYETETQYNDKTQGLLKTVNTQYWSGGPSYYSEIFSGLNNQFNVVKEKEITTWANGQVDATCYIYDSNTNTNCNGQDSYNPSGATFVAAAWDPVDAVGPVAASAATPLVYGSLLYQYDYDVGSGAQGALLRSTASIYQWQNNSSYLNANILKIPASVQIYDGPTAKQMSETDYSYDESAYMQTPGIYGLPTSIANGLSGQQVTSHNYYNSSGMPYLLGDPRGNLTYITYQCSGGYPQNVTRAYQSTTTQPETSTYGYDCNTGLLTSVQDPNGKTTGYGYTVMRDPQSVSYPDSGGTVANYGGYAIPLNVISTTAASPDPSIVSSVAYDGLGRPVTSTSPSGAITATGYDSDGRVGSVSNPYLPTDATIYYTSYAYDALNRKRYQCQPDNGTGSGACVPGSSYLQWLYTGNVTKYTDEVGNTWQRTTDGLGRLTKVVEPNGATTNYTYDALNNLLTVNQVGVSGDTPRNRRFTYDSLSHLITSTNPEMGTICYGVWSGGSPGVGTCQNGYDGNGNVSYETDSRGVTTNYTYDALNRLLSKTYSGVPASVASTPPSTFVYDTNNGSAVPNAIGRLVLEYTGPAGSPVTQRSIVQYDAMGRIQQESQCATAAGCSGTPHSFQYTYDLAGKMTSSSNGISTTAIGLTYTYDGAARLKTVTSSWNDATHPALLFGPPSSGAQYSAANGLSAAVLGVATSSQQPTYTIQRSYDDRLRPVSESDMGTGVTTPGTASTGSIGVSGTEQVSASTPSKGTITITGTPGSYQVCISAGGITNCPSLVFTPNTYVLINGPAGRFTAMASSAAGTTAAGVASTLTTALNGSGSPVTATVNGSVITLTSNGTGSSSNFMVYVSNLNEAGPGGTALAGGSGGASTPSTGTVTITGSPGSYQVCISAGGITNCPSLVFTPNTYVLINGPAGRFTAMASSAAGTTAAGVASTLTTALNGSGSPVTATANGSVITLTSTATGPSSDYMVYVSNLNESGPGGTALAGGTAGVPTYDTGTVTATINGATASYTWGSSDTGATVASGLEAAINQADSGFLGATLSGTAVNLASTQTGVSTNWPISCTVTDSNSTLFPTPSFAEACNGMTGGTNGTTGQGTVYSYSIPTGGYAPNGNLLNVSDSVMGNWGYSYDNLNRLSIAQASANAETGFDPYGSAQLNWSYDSFGNYEGQTLTGNTTVIIDQGTYKYTGHSLLNGAIGTGTPSNQIDNDCYDASGNLIGVGGGCSTYTYDAEGRLASVETTTTQYVYDAEGRRVAKLNGTTLTNQYLLGLGGEQVSELDGGGNWLHSNVYAAGTLLATYNNGGLHFHFSDWLGSRRVQANASGVIDETCQNLPFGDSLNCSAPGPDATEHHFTGKERDTESGLDYFGARYYGSTMGRFMSPDPSGLAYADITNPQSFNLYSYALNNPLKFVDPSGLTPCDFGSSDQGGEDYEDTDSDKECTDNGGTPIDYSETVNVNGNNSGSFSLSTVEAGSSTLIQYGQNAAPNKGNCTDQRVLSALMGTANVGLAAYKATQLAGTVSETASTEVGIPAAAVLAVYGTVSITGQAISGVAQLYSAATGNYGAPAEIAQIGNILSGPVSGLGTLVAGGSLAKAEMNAGIESTFTAGSGLVDGLLAKSLPPIISNYIDGMNSMAGLSPAPGGCGAGH